MVGTTSTDTRGTYYKGTIILREASMIRYTSCPWAWTQSSRSTPTSSMHNLSFTSRVWWSCSVEKFYLAKYQKSMTHENFRVHTYYERHRFNPSRHLRNIYHKLRSKYYKLERRALFKNRWYNLPKALYTHGKAHKVIQYEGHCRIKSNKGTDGPQGIWCEHRYSTRGRRMQGDLIIETTD